MGGGGKIVNLHVYAYAIPNAFTSIHNKTHFVSSFEQQNNSNINLSIDHQLIEEDGLYISHLLFKELLGSNHTKLCCIER